MRRNFQEGAGGVGAEGGRSSRWGGKAFTDEELSRRFDESQSVGDGELMDEAAARRTVAEARRREREAAAPPAAVVAAPAAAEPPLMDEAAARRMIAEQRACEQQRSATARSRSRSSPSRSRSRGIASVQSSSSSAAAPGSPRAAARRAAVAAVEATLVGRSRSRSRSPSNAAARFLRSPSPASGGTPGAAAAVAAAGGAVGLSEAPAPVAGGGEPAAGVDTFEVGGVVRLVGLKAAAHLNGQVGTLERFDAAGGRWEVKLREGDIKAIKLVNLERSSVLEAAVDGMRTPPASAGGSLPLSGGVAAISSASLAGGPRPGSTKALRPGSTKAVAAGKAPKPKTSRRFGTVRWYNGRRKCGSIIPDDGGADLFIPAQGAPNGSQVPPNPGGLMHGTRVSFMPMALKRDDPFSGQSTSSTVCMDVRALAGQDGLAVGVASDAGPKEQNDDRLAAADLHELGFLAGVFDGHRGSLCSEYIAKNLPPTILTAFRARAKRQGNLLKISHTKEADLIAGALLEAFESVDKAWLISARKRELRDGSTAIVTLVCHGFEHPLKPVPLESLGCAALWPKPKEKDPAEAKEERQPGTVPRAPGGVAKLFVAWAGDCRAVLCRGRQGLRVSEDHRPSNPGERARITKAGGTVIKDRQGVWRVGPRADNKLARELQKGSKDESKLKWFLSTCRGFGDPELKQPDPIITATPEVRIVDLVPEDWALVVASDGVWDRLSDQQCADLVWKSMVVNGRDPAGTSRDVVRAALSAGSRDNLTAVVLRLGWAAPPMLDSAAAAPEPGGGAVDEVSIFGGS